MEKIGIDFSGYIVVDKNNIVIRTLDREGKWHDVDATKLTAQEICNGIGNGTYYVDYEATNKNTITGEIKFSAEAEQD